MNYFDLLTDDMIIKILDIRCDEIELQIDQLIYDVELEIYEKIFGDDDEPNGFPDYYDPYDTDEIDQYYQDEIYLANLSSNI